mmetsp:Transcript_10772/g.39008  ORF Transcript_10772/g.39008 Transcript_10772/m.39008 type:complete len:248 (+) Transcript_10772:318-1061(+)
MSSLLLKYDHSLLVRFAREIVLSPPRNFVSAGVHLYGFCNPPADFFACFSFLSWSRPAASMGTYAAMSRAYRNLSSSAILSYLARVGASMDFHCSPSCFAISANFRPGCDALIFGRAICTKHMYAPLGPLGLFGSVTSLPLPRPRFLPFLSSLDFFPALPPEPSALRFVPLDCFAVRYFSTCSRTNPRSISVLSSASSFAWTFLTVIVSKSASARITWRRSTTRAFFVSFLGAMIVRFYGRAGVECV